MSDAVAVTGIGVVSPIGVGPRQFWSALSSGRSGIAALAGLAMADGRPSIAAAVRDFAAREFVVSTHHRRMDALSRMTVAACRMALDDARALGGVAPERAGIVFGSALGAVSESAQQLDRLFQKGPAAVSPMAFPNLVLNAPASYAAMEFGFSGVNFTLSQAEVSGEAAIALGADTVRRGRADLVLAGGGDEIAPVLVRVLHRARALAGQRGGREWASPYDAGRSGLVVGEGAAMLALEPLERARRRGAPVYACIAGSATFAVAAPRYDWPRRAAGAVEPLAALSGDAPIDVVCGAANSSPHLDACELDLFAALPATRAATVTSIKGAIGEFGAAGALTAAAACLALREQHVPPLCHLETAADTALRLASHRAEPADLRRALVCGSARGGAMTALLFERAS
ncbi:MAG TPA: beta-ketoacyl synthase N-terminal-like domain-containing protein [Candidatus Dormibacteraeota bacterium]|nr:beta-ketoacyl synthase N-terminal-like domain-containing protein [Candidatus Dormibacteraeota bacterium]